MADIPNYTRDGAIHLLTFPDGTRLEVHNPSPDRQGRLWAMVRAFASADHLLNRKRFDLYDQAACNRFVAACHAVDGAVAWGPRLLYATEQVANVLPHDTNDGKVLKVLQLSTVKPERVEFFWKPFLPKGRPVALEGDPGIGKSSLVAKIIAHLTTGRAFPTVLDGAPPPKDFAPRNVCLMTAEDDPADTLVPRIVVNGGNVQRVYLIEGWEQPDGEKGLVTLQDLTLLQGALKCYTPGASGI